MAETSIEWTGTRMPDGHILSGYTFNPWVGCTKVSPGCKHCYAEADMDKRRKKVTWGPKGTRTVTGVNYWQQPLKWEKEAAESGIRRKVFCASLADVFEDWTGPMMLLTSGEFQGSPLYVFCDEGTWGIPGLRTELPEYARLLTMQDVRYRLFRLIEATPHLDWLLLTKRPENVMQMVPEGWRKEFPRNVWMGTSTENQEQAEIRIPYLELIPAVVRFLSVEPMIGAINASPFLKAERTEFHVSFSLEGAIQSRNYDGITGPNGETLSAFEAEKRIQELLSQGVKVIPIGPACEGFSYETGCPGHPKPGIHWVICGGESGPGARPFDPQDAHALMQECKAAGVPFFFKQMGSAPYDAFNDCAVKICDRKGTDWDGWDELRVREWPEVVHG